MISPHLGHVTRLMTGIRQLCALRLSLLPFECLPFGHIAPIYLTSETVAPNSYIFAKTTKMYS